MESNVEITEMNESIDNTKRRTMLSIEQKAEICYKLESGVSVGTIADEYHIHPTTVRGIRRNGMKVRELANQGLRMLKKKRLRKPEFEDLEDRLHMWILERRKLGEPLSDSLLHKKALEINEQFGGPSSFKASVGWLVKFKHRRDISLCEKKERAKAEARKQFATEFEFFDCNKVAGNFTDEAGPGVGKIKQEPVDDEYERQNPTDEQYEQEPSGEQYEQEGLRKGPREQEPRKVSCEQKESKKRPCDEEEARREPNEQEQPRQSEEKRPRKEQYEVEDQRQETDDKNSSQKDIRHALEILTKHAEGAPRFIKSTLENLKDFFLGGET
ncbi:uncharacterized protein LOC143179281 [Calliopsis andreniformis]|uniref:uncharacterized protein LOC143179281 n=1 Tax=Calliopsis andreniformis TaxID=337506 RepID=UPI003FCCAA36